MSRSVVSQHGEFNAMWYQLTPGQTYRLIIRAWKQDDSGRQVCGGSIVFNYGEFQQQFDGAGGIASAVDGIAISFSDTQWCDIHATPHSQYNMELELRLQALNGKFLGETFRRSVSNTLSASFNLMLACVEDA